MSNAPDSHNTTEELLANRRAKLQRLRDEFGQDPYGHRVDGLSALADAKANFDADADQRFKDDPEGAGGFVNPQWLAYSEVRTERD